MLPCPQARSVHEFKPPVRPSTASQPWGSCGSINQSAFCWKAQSVDDGWAIVCRELKWQVTKKDTHTCINPLSFLSGLMLHHQGSRVKTYISVCVFMCVQVQVSQHVSCSANEVIRSVIYLPRCKSPLPLTHSLAPLECDINPGHNNCPATVTIYRRPMGHTANSCRPGEWKWNMAREQDREVIQGD